MGVFGIFGIVNTNDKRGVTVPTVSGGIDKNGKVSTPAPLGIYTKTINMETGDLPNSAANKGLLTDKAHGGEDALLVHYSELDGTPDQGKATHQANSNYTIETARTEGCNGITRDEFDANGLPSEPSDTTENQQAIRDVLNGEDPTVIIQRDDSSVY